MNKDDKKENSLEITTLYDAEKFRIIKNEDLNNLTNEQREKLVKDAIDNAKKNEANIIANRKKRYLSSLAVILVDGIIIAITVILILALIIYLHKK